MPARRATHDLASTAAILAGGRARRMGGGERIIQRGLLKASEIVEDVRNTPHDYERAREVVDRERRNRAALRDPITDATA